ncbi:MAG: ComEC/Rec2 family competence protein [Candidatus Babeliales bacterium]
MLYAQESPFFFPLLCLIAGIYLQTQCELPMGVLLGGVCLVVVGIIVNINLAPGLRRGDPSKVVAASYRRMPVSRLLIGLLFFCAGGVLVQAQRDWQHILLESYADKQIDIIGTIDDITQRAAPEYGQIVHIRVSRARDSTLPDAQDVDFKLVLYTTGRLAGLQVGDVITLQNISFSGTPSVRMTDGPSFQDHLLKEHIIGSVFIYGHIEYGLVHRPSWSIARWVWQLRESTYHGLKKKLTPKTLQYVALIFLGNKQQEKSEDLRQTFAYWGLSHYLARAGLHIVLFILVWQFLLNLLPIHLLIKRFLLIAMCCVYGLLSWYSIPFGRALYSFLLAEVGKFFGFQPTFFHTLTLLCCVILLFSPLQLFFLDFQLTFGLTFILSWYGRFTAPNKQES